MKVIAIIGEPGSGKTTLMSKLIDHYSLEPHYKDFKLVPYLSNENLIVLGKYEDGEVFGGTDKMSMAVQPEAIKFLDQVSSAEKNVLGFGNDNLTILFEGDRLGTATFLENCVDKYGTTIIYLKTEKTIREDRFKERGSNQNETWLAGRETKISNILTNFNLMFNTISRYNNDHSDLERNFEEVVRMIDE